MGSTWSSSRGDHKCEALSLCKQRKKFIKQAIDSRYAFTAAHLSYLHSLRNVGIALRRFAEAEFVLESSVSTSDHNKSPSNNSSYPSPIDDDQCSPLHTTHDTPSPLSTLSYMKVSGNTAVTVRIDSGLNRFVEDENVSIDFAPLPPPPPPFENDGSWDYFSPIDENESFRFVTENGVDIVPKNLMGLREFQVEEEIGAAGLERNFSNLSTSRKMGDKSDCVISGSGEGLVGNADLQEVGVKGNSGQGKNLCAEREDPSDFITHRAKDFLSSIKDIEHRFFRASECGKEVSRMLESSKIRLRCSEVKGRSPISVFLAAFSLMCCRGESVLLNEPPQQVTKVITWHRSVSSQSSSSKNPLALASKDDVNDSGSDFVEDFCMIAGSHSSTLDRLYAWERKLYDEVKASESIRKVYDQWCGQLRHQFARDASVKAIDKTRAVVKDLHSQIRVALHAVDSIAKRIEKLRDEELQPQLVEMIQGLTRMWKAMLECHHAQYITISLAYHSKSSTTGQNHGESHRQVVDNLQHEIELFRSSFADWVIAHRSYIEALNGWLQTCIVLPQERSRGRRAFSPRRALAPPIFVLCRDWSAGIKTLPSAELLDAIKSFVADLHSSVVQHVEEEPISQEPLESGNNEETPREDERSDNSSTLSSIHTSLTIVLDRLTKFAEALRKMYEDIRLGNEVAQVAYTNSRKIRL